jgi:hypothetical protein
MNRTIKRIYRFLELPTGWLDKQTGQTYKSFTGAQQALKRDAKRMIGDNPNAVFVQIVDWQPTTPVGRLIVRALTVNTVTSK